MNEPLPKTQRAIRLHPPCRDIWLEEVPVPSIEHEDDAIVKIQLSGLCGSDLHAYRGHEQFTEPFITGHEFIGHVVALGTSFTSETPSTRPQLYQTLKIGDKVVCPFTVSCQECEFCEIGFSCRCISSQLFGTKNLPGAQSQFIRVPKAGGSLIMIDNLLPDGDDTIPDEALLLLADILPTGYHAVATALKHPNLKHLFTSGNSNESKGENTRRLRLAIVGLGPVGLCALISAIDFMRQTAPSLQTEIVAIDPNSERQAKARSMVESCLANAPIGPITVEFFTPEGALSIVLEKEGFHAVCEIVGNNPALQLAYDLIRPFGVISSVGVHTAPTFPLKPFQLYAKNAALSFGRCPARSLFVDALDILERNKNILGMGGLIDQVITITPRENLDEGDRKVKDAYRKFEEGKSGKVLFDFWSSSP